MSLDLHVRQILEKELDIISGRKVVCLCCFHNAVDHCAGFCAGRRVAEQPVLSADCKGADLILCTVVGDFATRILQIVFHIRALSLSVLHRLFQATGQWLCAELIQPTPKALSIGCSTARCFSCRCSGGKLCISFSAAKSWSQRSRPICAGVDALLSGGIASTNFLRRCAQQPQRVT